jgi:hypothetical protein
MAAIEQVHRGLTILENEVAATGDDEAVNLPVMPPLHSFAMACHRGMACHLFATAYTLF